MPLTDPANLPSLHRVFGHNRPLMRAFKEANIRSIVPVMLLPREVLIKDVPGIGKDRATYITGALADHGLGHHSFNEKLEDFLCDQFGCVEDSPVSVLNIVVMRNNVYSRPQYSPLFTLQTIEMIDPLFTVLDILRSSHAELMDMLEDRIPFGPQLQRVTGDLRDIKWRLYYWEPDGRIGMHKARDRSLSLVHSQ